MIPIVATLSIVERYVSAFEDVFTSSELKQFSRYLCGLLTSENKTVEAINRLFVDDMMDQSTLNRFLSHSRFDIKQLNNARLDFLQSDANTAFKQGNNSMCGVLILDDTLLQHYGPKKEDVAWLRDPHNQSYHWSHNLVNLHYSDDTTDYPVDFRLWKPADLSKIEAEFDAKGFVIPEHVRERKQNDAKGWRKYLLNKYSNARLSPPSGKLPIEVVYQTKLDLAKQMVDATQARVKGLDLPYAFDTWYTSSDLLAHIDKVYGCRYVGTLDNEAVVTNSQNKEVSLGVFCSELLEKHRKAIVDGKDPLFKKMGISYKGKKEIYYAYCKTHAFRTFGRQKLVVSFSKEDLSDSEPKFYISNELTWRGPEILRIRRHRWPIEVYHQEGKAEGLDKSQLRRSDAIEKHIGLVCVAYSMLKRAQNDHALHADLQWKPPVEQMSLPLWRRMLNCEALLMLIKWAVEKNGGQIDVRLFADTIGRAFV